MNIKVLKLTESAKLPTKSEGDMCYDVYADEDAEVFCRDVTTIKTGIKICPPVDYHYSVRPRSGLAAKHGIDVLAGQIDGSYRGELLVCLTKVKMDLESNNFQKPYLIKKGDKIAQLKFEEDTTFPVVEVKEEEDLGYTTRGDQGFGSTGQQ